MPRKKVIDGIDQEIDREYKNAVYAAAGDDPDMYNLVMILGINPQMVKLFFASMMKGTSSGRR